MKMKKIFYLILACTLAILTFALAAAAKADALDLFDYVVADFNGEYLEEALGLAEGKLESKLTSGFYIKNGKVQFALLNMTTGKWEVATLTAFNSDYEADGGVFLREVDVATLASYAAVTTLVGNSQADFEFVSAATARANIFAVVAQSGSAYKLAPVVGGVRVADLGTAPYSTTADLYFSDETPRTSKITADKDVAPARVTLNDTSVIVLFDPYTGKVGVRKGIQKEVCSVNAVTFYSATSSLIFGTIHNFDDPYFVEAWGDMRLPDPENETYYVVTADTTVEFESEKGANDKDVYTFTAVGLFDLRAGKVVDGIVEKVDDKNDSAFYRAKIGDLIYSNGVGDYCLSDFATAVAKIAQANDDDNKYTAIDLSKLTIDDAETVVYTGGAIDGKTLTGREALKALRIRVTTVMLGDLAADYDKDNLYTAMTGYYDDVAQFDDDGIYYEYALDGDVLEVLSAPAAGIFDQFIIDVFAAGANIYAPEKDEDPDFGRDDCIDVRLYAAARYKDGNLYMEVIRIVDGGGSTGGHTHSLVRHEAVTATCAKAGHNVYYTCRGCGVVLKADKVTATTVAAETTPALGHILALTGDGFYTCDRCERKFTDAAGQTPAPVDLEGLCRIEAVIEKVCLNKDDGLESSEEPYVWLENVVLFKDKSGYGHYTYPIENLVIKAADLGITAETPRSTYLGLPVTLYISNDDFTQSAYDDGDVEILFADFGTYTTVENLGDDGNITFVVDGHKETLTLGSDRFELVNRNGETKIGLTVYRLDATKGWKIAAADELTTAFLYDAYSGEYVGTNSYGKVQYRSILNDDGDVIDVIVLYTPYAFGRYFVRSLKDATTAKKADFVTLATYSAWRIDRYLTYDEEDTFFQEYLAGTSVKVTSDDQTVSRKNGEKAKEVKLTGESIKSGDFYIGAYNKLDNVLEVAVSCGNFQRGRLTSKTINPKDDSLRSVKINGTTYSFGFKGVASNETAIEGGEAKVVAIINALKAGKDNAKYILVDGNVVYVESIDGNAAEDTFFDYIVADFNGQYLEDALDLAKGKLADKLTGGFYIDGGEVKFAKLNMSTGKWEIATLAEFDYGTYDANDEEFDTEVKNLATLANYADMTTLKEGTQGAKDYDAVKTATANTNIYAVVSGNNGVYTLAEVKGNVKVADHKTTTSGKYDTTAALNFSDDSPKTSKITADKDVEGARITLDADSIIVILNTTSHKVGIRKGVQKAANSVENVTFYSATSDLIFGTVTAFDVTDWGDASTTIDENETYYVITNDTEITYEVEKGANDKDVYVMTANGLFDLRAGKVVDGIVEKVDEKKDSAFLKNKSVAGAVIRFNGSDEYTLSDFDTAVAKIAQANDDDNKYTLIDLSKLKIEDAETVKYTGGKIDNKNLDGVDALKALRIRVTTLSLYDFYEDYDLSRLYTNLKGDYDGVVDYGDYAAYALDGDAVEVLTAPTAGVFDQFILDVYNTGAGIFAPERDEDFDFGRDFALDLVLYAAARYENGELYIEVFRILGEHRHELVLTEAKAATASAAGNNAYYTCSRCGQVYKDAYGSVPTTVAAETLHHASHAMTYYAAVTATATRAGRNAYYICNVCGKTFKADKSTETTVAAETLHHTSHTLTCYAAVAATCTKAGNNTYYVCDICGKVYKANKTTETTVMAETLPARGHSMTRTPARKPTEDTPGNNAYYTCGRCGKVFKDARGVTETTVEAETLVYVKPVLLTLSGRGTHAGGKVTLTLTMENAPMLKSLAITGITYDKSALTLVGGAWKIESELSDWNPTYATAAIALTENSDVNGAVFELTFKVKDSVEDGDYAVGCTVTAKTQTGPATEANVAMPSVRGAVQVTSILRGDVNGDDEVTSDDAILVLYHTLLPDLYPVNQDVDFNGDGGITSDDAIYLLYYTLLPDLYPLK